MLGFPKFPISLKICTPLFRSLRLLPAVLLLWTWLGPAVQAGEFPDRALCIVVPAPVGSRLDVLARQVAAPLALRLGQPVLVENRAEGARAYADVAQATPDGYVLLLGGEGLLAELAANRAKAYALGSFVPVTLATRAAPVLAIEYLPSSRHGQALASSQGFLAPAGTPGTVLRRLNSEITQVLRAPPLARSLEALGYKVVAAPPEEYSAALLRDLGAWARAARAAAPLPE